MQVDNAAHKIEVAVTSWPGVTALPHRFGGTEFRLGAREIGHIHGDGLVDIPFPKKLRDELVAARQVQPHHWLPDSGWISLPIHREEDLRWAVVLLRHSFELARQGLGKAA